ncbi:MAG: flagellar basal body L-ring protein FlgH [Pseudomonadota bacterium]
MNNSVGHLFNLLMLTLLSVTMPIMAESLYQEETYAPLVQDHRAYRVGQVVTVLIFEEATASTTSDTATSKNLDFGGALEGDDNGINHRFGGRLGLNNDFAGGGTIERAGRLVGRVTANITERLPSGEFLIAGSQEIAFNDEGQLISVSGRVRPIDISRDNTILSYRMADAKIVYDGDGILQDRQRPGVISRFVNWLF